MRGFLSLFFIIVVFCTGNGQDMSRLLPDSTVIPGWTVKKTVRIFTASGLFSYLPMETDLFTEYGFEKVLTVTYRNYMANTVKVDLFEMNNAAAAYGIYSFRTLPVFDRVEAGDESALYDFYIDVVKGKYYFRITASSNKFGLRDTLRLIASGISAKINENGKKPFLYSVLKDSLQYREVKYFKGLVALNQIYSFGHGSVAGFSEGVTGKKEKVQLFIIGYKDEKEARRWIPASKGKFGHYDDIYSDFKTYNDGGWSVKDKAGTPLEFLPSGRYLIILKGLERDEAMKVMSKIREVL